MSAVGLLLTQMHSLAGCTVSDGVITTKMRTQLVRNGQVLYQGHLLSLRHFKEEVAEIKGGNDCGIALVDWTDYQEGDLIQSYQVKLIPRKLEILDPSKPQYSSQ